MDGRNFMLKKLRIIGLFGIFAMFGFGAHAATNFSQASALLSAARQGDVVQVEAMVNSGVDVNYTDASGLSLVCTALMNGDTRAAQILQTYGADASRCDDQQQKYKKNNKTDDSGGMFSGLSSIQQLALAAGGAALVVVGVGALAGSSDSSNDNGGSSSGGNGNGGNGGTSAFKVTLPTMLKNGTAFNEDLASYSTTNVDNPAKAADFTAMSANGNQNYLYLTRAYYAFSRGYFGQTVLRNTKTKAITELPSGVNGGKPVGVALITTNGVTPAANYQSMDGSNPIEIEYAECAGGASQNCETASISSNPIARYLNLQSGQTESSFDLTGGTSALNGSVPAGGDSSKLAQMLIGQHMSGETDVLSGMLPNGYLAVYKVGQGELGVSDASHYKAMKMALALNDNIRPFVIANTSILNTMKESNTLTADGAIAYEWNENTFKTYINKYYNLNSADDATNFPGSDAHDLYTNYSTSYSNEDPLIIMSAGEYKKIDSLTALSATFDNVAPYIYGNGLKHRFASVVAVQLTVGTSGVTKADDPFPGDQKYQLSVHGTGDDTMSSRICGLTGTGFSVGSTYYDPWCFSAPGATGEEAVAVLSGAAGLIKSAFSYMNTDQVFVLMAATSDGKALDETTLKQRYLLPGEIQMEVNAGSLTYAGAFAKVFGYGVINLNRATMPGSWLTFLRNTNDAGWGAIDVKYVNWNVASGQSGNAFRAVTTSRIASTALSVSSAFGATNVAVSIPMFDFIATADGTTSIPRVYEMDFGGMTNTRASMNLSSMLSDLRTQKHDDLVYSENGLTMRMAIRPSSFAEDVTGGLDKMTMEFANDNFVVGAGFGHNLTNAFASTDIAGSFVKIDKSDVSNPYFAMVSNSVTSNAGIKFGNTTIGARGFSGSVTEENLVERDPVMSEFVMDANLGHVIGASSFVHHNMFGDKLSIGAEFGMMSENHTMLGMYGAGMLDFGNANTTYVDSVARFSPMNGLDLFARYTFANTDSNISDDSLLDGLSKLTSNAMSFGAQFAFNEKTMLNFSASQPLAVTSGSMKYASADFELIESESGYDLRLNPHDVYVDLSPNHRETRFSGFLQHQFNDITSGAIGFVYRINPNHDYTAPDETVFMLKMRHAVGF